MKAAVFYEHGSSEKLQIVDIDIPEYGENEILIEVKVFALNRLDIWVRNGSPYLKLQLPHIGGSDFAGIVNKVGKNVKSVKIGDKVVINAGLSCGNCIKCMKEQESECINFSMIGEHSWGGAAEYAVVPEKNVVKIPDDFEIKEAAAAALTTMTAYRMMRKSNIERGDLVLVIGASGGVGVMSVQLAKYFGATVIALTSSENKAKRLIEIGADYTVNYSNNENWSREVYELSKKLDRKGIDIVFDSVGEQVFEQAIKSLSTGGRYVTCGATTGNTGKINIALLFWKQLYIMGSTMASDNEFREAMKLVFDKKVHAIIDSEYMIDDISKAHNKLENKNHFGKILLKV